MVGDRHGKHTCPTWMVPVPDMGNAQRFHVEVAVEPVETIFPGAHENIAVVQLHKRHAALFPGLPVFRLICRILVKYCSVGLNRNMPLISVPTQMLRSRSSNSELTRLWQCSAHSQNRCGPTQRFCCLREMGENIQPLIQISPLRCSITPPSS